MNTRKRVLLVDDDELVRERLCAILERHSIDVVAAETGESAIAIVEEKDFDAFLVDVQLPGVDGFEVMGELRERCPDSPVVIITGHGTMDSAIDALRAGAFDFLRKPVSPEAMLLCLERIFQVRALADENRELRASTSRTSRLGSLIGRSAAMREVFSMVRRVANTASTVLITGESGTGKDVVARTLHEQSGRAGKPYLPINCAAITEGLLESELFGHVKGAFTGADATKKGLFVEGEGGTIFLDEIGEMGERMQTKLLRVLQDGEVRPVGSPTSVPTDVRIVAATNCNLRESMRQGKFRKDLFYRLNVIPIRLPPLRERPEDIPPLAEFFLGRLSTEKRSLSEDALEALCEASWPGNARELENTIERTLALTDAECIEREDLAFELDLELEAADEIHALLKTAAEGGVTLRELERLYIAEVLRLCAGNKMKAARLLGVNRTTLYRRLDA